MKYKTNYFLSNETFVPHNSACDGTQQQIAIA